MRAPMPGRSGILNWPSEATWEASEVVVRDMQMAVEVDPSAHGARWAAAVVPRLLSIGQTRQHFEPLGLRLAIAAMAPSKSCRISVAFTSRHRCREQVPDTSSAL